jgi:hypothetical protein
MRGNAGISNRGAGDAADQRFDVRFLQPAEWRMRPANDAGFGHDSFSSNQICWKLADPVA